MLEDFYFIKEQYTHDQDLGHHRAWMGQGGREVQVGGDIYIYIQWIHFICTAETNTTLQCNYIPIQYLYRKVQFSSVAQSCLTLCDPMNCSTPGLPVHHQLPEFTQTHVHRISNAIQPSHPLSSLLLLPPIPPSIRVFSNESTLHMRWPKSWSFSFSIIPSNEHPGLISFRTDWLDLLAVQGTLRSLRGMEIHT